MMPSKKALSQLYPSVFNESDAIMRRKDIACSVPGRSGKVAPRRRSKARLFYFLRVGANKKNQGKIFQIKHREIKFSRFFAGTR
jgi:hypothetical protein